MELHDGDIIIFKDNINTLNEYGFVLRYLFNFISNNSSYEKFAFGYGTSTGSGNYTSIDYGSITVYRSSEGWLNTNYKTITIVGNQTITDESFINWLYENTVSGLPPRVMENMYAVVGDQIQYSFSNIGDVVGSIVNNGVLSIFTFGIFIISVAVGILRRLARRDFRKK